MTTFLALYRGETIEAAELVAVSVDPALIQLAAAHTIAQMPQPDNDPVLRVLHERRLRALWLLTTGANDATGSKGTE